jgi:hypothetical protein
MRAAISRKASGVLAALRRKAPACMTSASTAFEVSRPAYKPSGETSVKARIAGTA